MNYQDNLLLQRRSTWVFQSRVPDNDVLTSLLDVGRWAPSAANSQPWRFLVVSSEDHPQLWEELYHSLEERNLNWAATAPVFLITYIERVTDELGRGLAWHDCGVSLLQISLEAERQGLATHAIGLFDRNKVALATGLSSDFEIPTMLAIGYREEELDNRPPPERIELSELMQFGAIPGEIAK